MPEPVKILTVAQCQELLGLPRSTTYRLLAHEPGVSRILVPGSKKPIIRVESTVIDRIRRRSTIPA